MRNRKWLLTLAGFAVVSGIAAIGFRGGTITAATSWAKGTIAPGCIEPSNSRGILLSRNDSGATTRISPDLFGAPGPKPPPLPPPPKPAPVPPPPAPDPLADWTFTGFATLDGVQYGLLENSKTHNSRYVQVGDEIEGFRVDAMDRSGVRLSRAGTLREIAMNGKFDMVPLDKSAEYLGGASFNHAVADADVAGQTARIVRFALADSARVLLTRPGGENMDKLTNDVFSGKISQDEFDQRKASAGVFLLDEASPNLSSFKALNVTLEVVDGTPSSSDSVIVTYAPATQRAMRRSPLSR